LVVFGEVFFWRNSFDDPDGNGAWVVGAAAGVVALLLWCAGFVRAYLRGTGRGVRVLPDRVEILRGARADTVESSEIERLVLHRGGSSGIKRIELRARDGRRHVFVDGEWPVVRIASRLERVLVPVLVERSRAGLAADETLTFEEEPYLTGMRLMEAALLVVAGIVIAHVASSEGVGAFSGDRGRGLGEFALHAWIFGGVLLAHRSRKRGGGIVLTQTGIRRLGEDAKHEVPFAALRSLVITPEGLSVEGPVSRRFRLTGSGANYAVLAGLLPGLVPASA
jgi:hypothetical protein